MVSLYSLFYCTVINPDLGELMAKETEKSLLQSGMPLEAMAGKLDKVRQEFSTSRQVIQSLIGQTFVGSIASLIIGIFIKTKKNSI